MGWTSPRRPCGAAPGARGPVPGHLMWRAAARVAGRPRPGRCPRRRHPRVRRPAGAAGGASHGPNSRLADSVAISRTTMAKVASALVDQGLVERVRNPDDRRSYALTRTPEGAAAARRWRRHAEDLEEALTPGFTPRRARGAPGAAASGPRPRLAPDTPEPLQESLAFLITRVHVRMHRGVLGRRCGPWASCPAHFGLLTTLRRGPGRRRPRSAAGSASAARASSRWSTTSSGAGLVERRRLEWDRRTQVLHLLPRRRGAGARRGGPPSRCWLSGWAISIARQRQAAGPAAPAVRHRRVSTSRQTGFTRPGGSISSSDSATRRRRPRGCSISARVSVHGGSAVRWLVVARTTWTTRARPAWRQQSAARPTTAAHAARGAAPGACRSRRPGRRHRRSSSARSSRLPVAVVDGRVGVAVARPRRPRPGEMSNAVVRQPCAARCSESAPSPQPTTTARPARQPSPCDAATQPPAVDAASVRSQGRATSPRPAADQSSSYQRVGSPSATAATPSSSARSSHSRPGVMASRTSRRPPPPVTSAGRRSSRRCSWRSCAPRCGRGSRSARRRCRRRRRSATDHERRPPTSPNAS